MEEKNKLSIELNIPESWKDVKLWQYQEFVALDKINWEKPIYKTIEQVSVLLDYDVEEIKQWSFKDLNTVLKQLNFIAHQPDERFSEVIEINGKKYAIQKDLSKVSNAEFIDLSNLTDETAVENLHYICSILYKPVIEEFEDGSYTIQDKYSLKEYERNAAYIKEHLSIKDVYGVLVFFCSLSKEYIQLMLTSSFKNQNKVKMKLIQNFLKEQQLNNPTNNKRKKH